MIRKLILLATLAGALIGLGAAAAVTAAPAMADTPTPCTTSDFSGGCPGSLTPTGGYGYGYVDPSTGQVNTLPNANGYNTYVEQQGFACPGVCTEQDLSAFGPSDWTVTANDPLGNESVLSYPDTTELFNNWTGMNGTSGPWCGGANGNCSSAMTNTPLADLSTLQSTYTETMPDNATTDVEAAYDIWQGSYPNDVMIWVDNVNRGTGGAQVLGHATFAGQGFTLLGYDQGDELIWSMDGATGEGSYFNAPTASGTVHIKAMLEWLHRHDRPGTTTKFLPNAPQISAIDFGWELCSTGGTPENFSVSNYGITATIK